MPEPIRCPDCGVAMNHHADKVVQTAEAGIDPVFDGGLEEMHACPECGLTETRPAE